MLVVIDLFFQQNTNTNRGDIIKLITVKTVCFNQSSRLNVCQHMTCLIPRGQDLFQHVFRKEVSIIYSLRNQIWWVKQCISKVLFRKNCIVSIPFIGYWPPHFNPEEILGNICFWNPHYYQPAPLAFSPFVNKYLVVFLESRRDRTTH